MRADRPVVSRRMRGGNFDVAVEANCQSVVNPLLDIGKYLPTLGLSRELRRLRGPEVDRALQQDAARDRSRRSSAPPMRAYEKHTLDTEAHAIVTPWWYRIIAAPVLREGLEDQPEPLPEPGPREHLAGQVADARPEAARRCIATSSTRAAAGDPDAGRGGRAGVRPDAPDPGRHLRGPPGLAAARTSTRRRSTPAAPQLGLERAADRCSSSTSSWDFVTFDFGTSMWSGKPVIAGDRRRACRCRCEIAILATVDRRR